MIKKSTLLLTMVLVMAAVCFADGPDITINSPQTPYSLSFNGSVDFEYHVNGSYNNCSVYHTKEHGIFSPHAISSNSDSDGENIPNGITMHDSLDNLSDNSDIEWNVNCMYNGSDNWALEENAIVFVRINDPSTIYEITPDPQTTVIVDEGEYQEFWVSVNEEDDESIDFFWNVDGQIAQVDGVLVDNITGYTLTLADKIGPEGGPYLMTLGGYLDEESNEFAVVVTDGMEEEIVMEWIGDIYGNYNISEYKGQYVFEIPDVSLEAESVVWFTGLYQIVVTSNSTQGSPLNTTILDKYLDVYTSDLKEDYNDIELSPMALLAGVPFDFAPTEPGIYNVSVNYAGRFDPYYNWWRVVYSDAPISEELTGSLIGMTNLSSATDVTIEKASVGGVDFGDEVLDLTGFVDIDSIITIEHAKIGIDTTVFTGFDKPATLTMYGLTSPGTPIILKDGVECGTECNVTSYADGTLVFTVAGFSVYEAKDNIAADLSLPATATLGSSAQERNQTIKGSFIASNFGTDRAINDFNLTCNADNMYKVNFSTTEGGPWTESLSDLDFEIGENKTIYMKGFIPFSQDSGSNVEICKIEMDNGQMQRSTSLVINPISKLGFHKLTVYVDGDKDTVNRDGDTVSDLKPESRIKVKAELKNLFTDEEDIEIQDAFFEIIAENLDEDEDIEEESKEVDLRPERDKDLTIEFDVPLEIDEDTYNMVVKAEGEDEKGATHTLEWTVILDVEKDNHDIRISRASLGSSELACTRSTIFTVEIKNVGSKDEEDVKLVVNNPDLGIDYIKTGLDLDVYGDDDEFSKSFSINLADDFPTGTYPIEVDVDYNGKSSDRKTVDLVVNECTRVDYTADKEDPEVITPSDLQPLDTEEFPDFEQKIEEKVSGWYIAVLIVLIIAILVVFMYTLSLIRK